MGEDGPLTFGNKVFVGGQVRVGWHGLVAAGCEKNFPRVQIPPCQRRWSLIKCILSPGGEGCYNRAFLGSSVVERPAVNRVVAGSNPARGANPAPIAQLVERIHGKDEVTSSSLVGSSIHGLYRRFWTGGIARGSVAQSVEQRTENPRVGGSIPSRATTCHLSSVGRALHS